VSGRLMNIALALYILLEIVVIFYVIEVEIKGLLPRRHDAGIAENL
jgi:hypothetical protein